MFIAEIRIPEEVGIGDVMASMREWLNHQRLEPQVFRYRFHRPGIIVQVEFGIEKEAGSFASAFGGRVIPPLAARPAGDTDAEAAATALSE
jgi:hypothetical protein